MALDSFAAARRWAPTLGAIVLFGGACAVGWDRLTHAAASVPFVAAGVAFAVAAAIVAHVARLRRLASDAAAVAAYPDAAAAAGSDAVLSTLRAAEARRAAAGLTERQADRLLGVASDRMQHRLLRHLAGFIAALAAVGVIVAAPAGGSAAAAAGLLGLGGGVFVLGLGQIEEPWRRAVLSALSARLDGWSERTGRGADRLRSAEAAHDLGDAAELITQTREESAAELAAALKIVRASVASSAELTERLERVAAAQEVSARETAATRAAQEALSDRLDRILAGQSELLGVFKASYERQDEPLTRMSAAIERMEDRLIREHGRARELQSQHNRALVLQSDRMAQRTALSSAQLGEHLIGLRSAVEALSASLSGAPIVCSTPASADIDPVDAQRSAAFGADRTDARRPSAASSLAGALDGLSSDSLAAARDADLPPVFGVADDAAGAEPEDPATRPGTPEAELGKWVIEISAADFDDHDDAADPAVDDGLAAANGLSRAG